MPNALIPTVTVVGLQFGTLLAGAVITEVVFSWPGIGSLLVTSILNRDFPVVQATLLVVSLTFLLVNLLTDLLYFASIPDPHCLAATRRSAASPRPRPTLATGAARAIGTRLGLALLAFYAALAIVGPVIVRGDPYKQQLRFAGDPPSWSAPLGYDELGRDMLTRIAHGARYTIGIAVAAIAIGGGIGILLGASRGMPGAGPTMSSCG